MSLPHPSEDWEQAPQVGQARRRLALGLAVLALAAVSVWLLARSNPPNTSAVAPAAPTAGPRTGVAPAVDQTAFLPVDLPSSGTVSHTRGRGRLLAETSATTILAVSGPDLHVIDVATGDLRTLRLPDTLALDAPTSLFGVGDSLIIGNASLVARVTVKDLRATRLASPHSALPTYADASVWLVTSSQSTAPRIAVRVGLDGTVQERIALPAVVEPVAGTADVLAVSAPGGLHLVAGAGPGAQALPGQLAALSTQQLARTQCTADLVCRIVIGTLEDPDQARAPLTANEIPLSYYGTPAGEFSPDGRLLALPLVIISASGEMERTDTAIIDTATGVEIGRVRRRAYDHIFEGDHAWTPDSRWLVLTTNEGLSAWSVQQRRTSGLDVDAVGVGRVVVR